MGNRVITNLMKQKAFKSKIYQALLKTHKRSDAIVMGLREDIDTLDYCINILSSKGLKKNGY